MKKVVVITGPTGIGKTDISLKVAKIFNASIINADASQFRKMLNIGTAKVDLTNVSVKHYLIDFLSPTESFSIYNFQKEARLAIDEISSLGKLPIIVGGSGLYINSTIYDYDLSSEERDETIEEKYLSVSNEELHEMLKKVDEESSKKIHPNNRRRVIRAYEVALKSDKLISQNISHKELYEALIIVLDAPREVLYERINNRVEEMFKMGWVDEVKDLKEKKIDLSLIKEIGYREINEYLESTKELSVVKEEIKQKTRNYAKRQITWFKNKMKCTNVFMNYQNPSETLDEITQLILKFINN